MWFNFSPDCVKHLVRHLHRPWVCHAGLPERQPTYSAVCFLAPKAPATVPFAKLALNSPTRVWGTR